jgi:hypothetical protein
MTTNWPLMRPMRITDDRQHVRIVIGVGRQDGRHHLNFIHVMAGEKRADGPVAKAGGQDFLGAWPAFALDESAGELARGVSPFTIIDGEREKVPARNGRPFHRSDKHNLIAETDQHSPVGLLGQLAGFQTQNAIA